MFVERNQLIIRRMSRVQYTCMDVRRCPICARDDTWQSVNALKKMGEETNDTCIGTTQWRWWNKGFNDAIFKRENRVHVHNSKSRGIQSGLNKSGYETKYVVSETNECRRSKVSSSVQYKVGEKLQWWRQRIKWVSVLHRARVDTNCCVDEVKDRREQCRSLNDTNHVNKDSLFNCFQKVCLGLFYARVMNIPTPLYSPSITLNDPS